MADSTRVANALGVDAVSIGRHYLRSPQRERIGSLQIRGIFRLLVKPSFHEPLCLWIVSARGEPFGDSTTPSWIKAAIEYRTNVFVTVLHENPLVECLQSLDLTENRDGITLDGVGYELAFETTSTKGVLHFSNPRTLSLRNIESTMFVTAKAMLGECTVPGIAEAVASWGEYAASAV